MRQQLPLTDLHLHARPLLLLASAKMLHLMFPSGRCGHELNYSDSVMRRQKEMVGSRRL